MLSMGVDPDFKTVKWKITCISLFLLFSFVTGFPIVKEK